MKQKPWLPKMREEFVWRGENMLHSNDGWPAFCPHGRTLTTTALTPNWTLFNTSTSPKTVKSISPSNLHGLTAPAACLTSTPFASDFVKSKASVLSMQKLSEFPAHRVGLEASIAEVCSFVDFFEDQERWNRPAQHRTEPSDQCS